MYAFIITQAILFICIIIRAVLLFNCAPLHRVYTIHSVIISINLYALLYIYYLLNSSGPYPRHWMSSVDRYANWVYWMVAHAYYRTRTDVSMDDAFPAMESTDYLISIYCVAVGRCDRAFLAEPAHKYVCTVYVACRTAKRGMGIMYGYISLSYVFIAYAYPNVVFVVAYQHTTQLACCT